MPYKIYTYEDPYKLDKTDFWYEIKALPHFCVSRTLVNGFKDVMRDSIEGLICPLDDLVSHEKIYGEWTKNISLRLRQFSDLTSIFKSKRVDGEIDAPFHSALMQNQNQFLDAIRLFLELGISSSALDDIKANKEQRLYISVLRDIQVNGINNFSFPTTPSRNELHQIINELAENELIEFEKKRGSKQAESAEKDRQWYARAIKNTKAQKFNTVVVHGVHQFSPEQLRLIIDLDKMGLTVIFLFNYQQRFSEIYASWKYIYQCFEAPIHHDVNIKEYQPPALQNASNALASALGSLCEGFYKSGDRNFREWYALYGKSGVREFANITEYAHFISDHFDNAITAYHNDLGIVDRGNRVWDNSAVLRYLDEQVYTANRDVHTLLKIYYPEYSKDRHFLAYPIGQFFSAIYRLWNWERGEIDLSPKEVKECLSSGILSSGKPEELLRIYYTISIILENIGTFKEFESQIKVNYTSRYEQIMKTKGSEPTVTLKQLSIYNAYKVKNSDIQMLIKAFEEINVIAIQLFSINNTHEDYINFGKHFQNLEEFIKKRQLELVNEEERALITALLLRFDKIKPSSSFSGTFKDLQEGLHFFLKHDDEDDNGTDWIVKNFEQIDGDILQSKGQFERGEKKVYHFACVSDRDMNCPIDNLLPWPLSDFFIRKAYSPIDLQFQVYYSSLGERGNFLRYALFYGLFFNRCDMRLSYVKQYGDETTEQYALTSILGLRPDPVHMNETEDENDIGGPTIKNHDLLAVKYDRFEMMSMFLCPYRYFLEYILSNEPVVQGNFLYQKFNENLLIETVWKKIQGMPKQLAIDALERVVSAESALYRPYFFFWKDTEIFDLELRAKNYILHNIINADSNNTVHRYEESHMRMRRLFGKAKYVVDISAVELQNPYADFERLANKKYPQKSYSLYSIPEPSPRMEANEKIVALQNTVCNYLNQSEKIDKTAISSDWCTFCVNRGVCLEPYLQR